MNNRLKKEKTAYQALEYRRELKTPTAYLQDRRFAFDHLLTRMQTATEQTLSQHRQQFGELAAYLDAFSPLKVLARGYSVVHRDDGRIVNSSALLKKQDRITIQFAKGSAVCLVEQIKRK
jgi:exodeoxyribonuclease VII large subunit